MGTIPWMTVLPWILLGAGSQTDSSLLAPRLSSSLPYNFIIKGEEIPLNCSLPKGVESGSPKGSPRRFFFYCRDQSYLPIGDHHLPNNTFNLRTENLSSGKIKIICTCKISPEGGTYSPESNQLAFSVVDVPLSPVLRVDLLSQRVKEGDPLVFLCSTEGGDAEKKFHFYKDGVEITSREEGLLDSSSEPSGPLQNASLRIPHASFNHSGEFACSYEEKRSNRWVMSSLSKVANITVDPVNTGWTQDSDPIWRYSWMAIPLIILLVPLGFCCWKKRSTSASQEPFQLMEKKEERNDVGVMEPPAATAAASSPVKVTYSCIQDSFTPSPPGQTKRTLPTQRGKEEILYSDVVFPPKRRQQNHP